MKVIKIEQNSDEWLEYRKGKSGGSELKNLWVAGAPLKSKIVDKLEKNGKQLSSDEKKMTIPELATLLSPEELAELKISGRPKKRYYEMLAERVARPMTPNDYVDRLEGQPFSMMARGHILEPDIAEAFEKATGKVLDADSVIWESGIDPNIYVSPDRTITSEDGKVREAVEIKALSSPNVLEVWKTQQIPDEYMPQVYQYFVVNEDLETLYWVVGTDLIPGLELQIFEVKREHVQPMLDEVMAFQKVVMKMVDDDEKRIMQLGGF